MNLVEIIYRYVGDDAAARPRPADATEARNRLDEGNRAFAALLDGLTQGTGTARRVISVDPRDLGLLPGTTVRQSSARMRPCSAAPTHACRSS